MIDSAAVLVELAEYIASQPNHRRQDLLVRLAELQAAHRVPEDELDRALRLVTPQMLDLLFNRAPELMQAARQTVDGPSAAASTAGEHDEAVRPSLAAV